VSAAVLAQPVLPFIHPDDMPDRYALTGIGTCMEPIFTDGALLAFDKRAEPKPGDIIGIIFTREAALRRNQPGSLKRLVMSLPPPGFDGYVVAEQVNPHRVYHFPIADILAVHKFIGEAIRFADGSAGYRPQAGEA
jgi:hypothetical protein